MSSPLLLRGVDRAAVAVALVARLRDAGVRVSASGPAGLVQALGQLAPSTRSQLYWVTRLTLVNRADDLAAFDSVFAAVFGGAATSLDQPGPQRVPQMTPPVPGAWNADGAAVDATTSLPWVTRPSAMTALDDTDSGVATPDALPSRLVARADEPFDRFDPEDLRLLGSWLEASAAGWPRRRSLRRELNRHGKRIDLRRTMNASRTTGWEALMLARTRRRQHPRRVVLVCDVSRSMQPYATIYLHLMRAA
ncbi:MAG: VWA domain-containing protein, partial [Mycobacterium sp.]